MRRKSANQSAHLHPIRKSSISRRTLNKCKNTKIWIWSLIKLKLQDCNGDCWAPICRYLAAAHGFKSFNVLAVSASLGSTSRAQNHSHRAPCNFTRAAKFMTVSTGTFKASSKSHIKFFMLNAPWRVSPLGNVSSGSTTTLVSLAAVLWKTPWSYICKILSNISGSASRMVWRRSRERQNTSSWNFACICCCRDSYQGQNATIWQIRICIFSKFEKKIIFKIVRKHKCSLGWRNSNFSSRSHGCGQARRAVQREKMIARCKCKCGRELRVVCE